MSSSKTIKNKQNSEKVQVMERRFRIYAAFAIIGAVTGMAIMGILTLVVQNGNGNGGEVVIEEG